MTDLLILVPTRLELDIVQGPLGVDSVELCGFGPIAAAARTAQLIATHQPHHVLLVGIAGAYGERLEIGTAHMFESVACYGIGAGSGDEFQSASLLGWPQRSTASPLDSIRDVISLENIGGGKPAGQLLTTCAAASNLKDVNRRLQAFPAAVAEDMEGFGVALACRLTDVPLTVIRGISNQAGNRDQQDWQIQPALQAAASLARSILDIISS
jgi:futalosine hydrolase